MGSSASELCISPMQSVPITKARCLKKTSDSVAITPMHMARCSFSWIEFLHMILDYLDSDIYRSISLVSRSWCRVYDCRGSLTSVEAISRLLGVEMAHRISSYWTTEQTFTNIYELRGNPPEEWIDVCDFIMGYFHSSVPNGSQTSTTMALALASEFIMRASRNSPSSDAIQRQIDELKSNSYLLSFTAMAIAVKIEEGLYFEADLIPFPRVDISNVSYCPLSSKDVLDAEQLILMVLRLTVPVCYFAQFARPLWDRMRSVDSLQREHCLLTPKRGRTADEANSINSKSVIFRFIHHASARYTDCSSTGSAIHPSVKALCVCILSISISSVLNLKYRTQKGTRATESEIMIWEDSLCIEGQPKSDTVIDTDPQSRAIHKSPHPTLRSNTDKKNGMGRRKVNMAERSQLSNARPKQRRKLAKAVITPAPKASRSLESAIDNKLKRASKVLSTISTTCLLQVTPLKYPPSLSSTEYFCRELVAALLYEDLKDRESQEEESQNASSIHVPRKALRSITMTLDALQGNLDELRSLKDLILEERTIEGSSVSHSTRSATASLPSPVELPLRTPDTVCSSVHASVKTLPKDEAQMKSFKSKKRNLTAHQNQCESDVRMNTPVSDYCQERVQRGGNSLSVETFRILLNTNVIDNHGAKARKLVVALCDISLKEIYSIQTQITSAIYIAFSRYQVRSFPASYPSKFPSSSLSAQRVMHENFEDKKNPVNSEKECSKIIKKKIMVQNYCDGNGSTNDGTLPRRLDL